MAKITKFINPTDLCIKFVTDVPGCMLSKVKTNQHSHASRCKYATAVLRSEAEMMEPKVVDVMNRILQKSDLRMQCEYVVHSLVLTKSLSNS